MYLIDDFDNEYNDSSNNLFDENMFINYDIEKENMLSTLYDFYDEDELNIDENSSYEEIKEQFDKMMDIIDEINDDFTKLGQEYNKCVITDTCGRQVIVERKTKENYIQEITVKVLGSDGSEIEGTTQKYNIRSTMNTANMDTYAQILDSYTNQEGL